MPFLLELVLVGEMPSKGSSDEPGALATFWLPTSSQGVAQFRVRRKWSLETSKRYVLGRNPDCTDIVIPHGSMSRNHAAIQIDVNSEKHGLVVKVEDLGSSNGTWVNGDRLEESLEVVNFNKKIRIKFAQNPSVYSISEEDPVSITPDPKVAVDTANTSKISPPSAPPPRKRRTTKWDAEEPSDTGSKNSDQPAIDSSTSRVKSSHPSSARLGRLPSEPTASCVSSCEAPSTVLDNSHSKSVYMNSFSCDSSRRSKFLKLMGCKEADLPLPPSHTSLKPKDNDVTAELERQYSQGLKWKDGRKTGLGGI